MSISLGVALVLMRSYMLMERRKSDALVVRYLRVLYYTVAYFCKNWCKNGVSGVSRETHSYGKADIHTVVMLFLHCLCKVSENILSIGVGINAKRNIYRGMPH